MKIPVKDIEQFIANTPKNIKAILLYGPDNGLIKIRVAMLSKSHNIAGKFTYDQIKSHPFLLLDSLNSINLFNSNLTQEKVVLVECHGTGLVDPVLNLIKTSNYQGLIVFYAGELGPDSSLRRFFDTTPNVASIPCYIDDQASIIKVIQQIFKQRQITCEAGLISLLLHYIPMGDRSLIINEIEKILLFLNDKKQITTSDIKDYLEVQGEVSFDKLSYQLSLRQVDETELLLNNLQNEGHNLVSIVRMVARHFTRLLQTRLLIDQGKTEQQALDALVPALFFKQINDFSKSIKLWNKVQLIEILQQLTEVELAAKKASLSAELTLKKLIMEIKNKS